MSSGIGQAEIQTISHVLALAEHDLSFLQGARVTDIPDDNATWRVDNSSTLEAIDEALALLDKLDNTRNLCCS